MYFEKLPPEILDIILKEKCQTKITKKELLEYIMKYKPNNFYIYHHNQYDIYKWNNNDEIIMNTVLFESVNTDVIDVYELEYQINQEMEVKFIDEQELYDNINYLKNFTLDYLTTYNIYKERFYCNYIKNYSKNIVKNIFMNDIEEIGIDNQIESLLDAINQIFKLSLNYMLLNNKPMVIYNFKKYLNNIFYINDKIYTDESIENLYEFKNLYMNYYPFYKKKINKKINSL